VLALPLDVANTKVDGGLRIDVIWQILYTTIAVFCIAVIPFAIFYYESEDPDSNKSQLMSALKWTVLSTFVSLFFTFMMWAFLGEAEVPIAQLSSNMLIDLKDDSYPHVCSNPAVRARARAGFARKPRARALA